MSRSARAFHKGTLPMITVSITRNWSNANWSWRSTPNFFGRVMDPLVGSISPVKIFISVDLPAPLGPVTAYRRPGRNVQVTSSNRVRAPKRMEMLLTESKAITMIAHAGMRHLVHTGRVPNGTCASLRREFSGEPDAGKPHPRFDEGRARLSPLAVTLSLLLYRLGLDQQRPAFLAVMMVGMYLKVAPEIRRALQGGRPVVALESTIITHGMPYPENLETARSLESQVWHSVGND